MRRGIILKGDIYKQVYYRHNYYSTLL
uniref:Uncharacterized protein n=1 Tax=Lepeophtheirus salmonis TaxID=72036 RepID=A0A0K2SY36_LEPSM